MKRLAVLLPLLLALSACQKTSTPDASAAAPDSGADAGTPSAAAEAAATAANSGAPAATSTVAGAATAQADSATSTFSAAAGPNALVPGTDYVEIPGGQPFQPLNGKIEVVEVFNFICPACARFEPLLSAWMHKLPADVRVTYLPADFNPQWRPYAQAYVVADAMGLDAKSHDAVFNAVHVAHTLPGEVDKPDDAKIAAFYGKYGADPKQFLDAMHSFSTDAKLKRGKQFLLATGVDGTPTIIIDGKYRVTGKSDADNLRITDQLIARERAAGAGAAAVGQ